MTEFHIYSFLLVCWFVLAFLMFIITSMLIVGERNREAVTWLIFAAACTSLIILVWLAAQNVTVVWA